MSASSDAPPTASRSEVVDLYVDYADLLDRQELDTWLELFDDDADYRVVSAENVALDLPLSTMRAEGKAMLRDRIYTIEHTQMFTPRQQRHFISTLRARPASTPAGAARPDAAPAWAVTASFLVVETLPDEPTALFCSGRYDDLVVAGVDGPRFARKTAIYDSPLVNTSLIYPL